MILDYKRFRSIKTLGIILLLIGVLGFFALITNWYEAEFYDAAIVFILVMSAWHLITGLGILVRKKWGFALMKFYLYVLLLGNPVGTLLAKRILGYIKENEIEFFFSGKDLQL